MEKQKSNAEGRLKYKVFLIDEHPILREGFARMLNYEPDLQVCGQAGKTVQALSKIAALKPDLVVLDLGVTGGNGLEAIKQIKTLAGGPHILAFSVHEEPHYAERALRAGAGGYVLKAAPVGEVMAAIREVAQGRRYLSQEMQEELLESLSGEAGGRGVAGDIEQLSDRELEVFQLIGHGSGTREIAQRLHLSIKTVETHRARLREKLKLRTGLALIRHAVETATLSSRENG